MHRTPLEESIRALEVLDRMRGGTLWFFLAPELGSPPEMWTIARTVEHLDEVLEVYEGGEEPRSRRAVQGSLMLEAWAWTALTPALHLLLFDGTILELGDPTVQILAPPGQRPAALAVDAAGPLGAAPRKAVPGDPAGIDLLLGPIIAFHQPLIDALHAHTGRSKRALWRSVRDRLASAILASGEAFGRQAVADAMLERVMIQATVGRKGAGVPRFERPPGRAPTLARGGCCLWWRTGAAPCGGCPIALAQAG